MSKAPQSTTVQRVSTVQMVQVLTGNSVLQVPIVTGRTWYVSKTAQSVPLVSTVKAQTWQNQQATAVPVSTVYLEQLRQTPTWRTWPSALLILNTSLLVMFVHVVISVKKGVPSLKVFFSAYKNMIIHWVGYRTIFVKFCTIGENFLKLPFTL